MDRLNVAVEKHIFWDESLLLLLLFRGKQVDTPGWHWRSDVHCLEAPHLTVAEQKGPHPWFRVWSGDNS